MATTSHQKEASNSNWYAYNNNYKGKHLSGFVWEREFVDHDYIIVDHEETPLREENVLRTRASAYKKVTDNLTPKSPRYAISPTGWDTEKWSMTEPNIWDKITTYVAENKINKAYVEDSIDNLVDDQKLDCIYDDEPLGFEENPLGSTTKMRAHDPLEEVDLGDGSVKRPTYVSAKIPKEFKDRIMELLKEYKDCFAWDYNEMLGLRCNALLLLKR